MMAHEAMQLAERTTTEFCNTVKRGGVSSVGIKVAQWLTWTGRFDSGPAWDIENYDAMMATKGVFEAESIHFEPWCCPMGLDANGNIAYDSATTTVEAQFYAKIARATRYLDLDIEPYPDFCPALANSDYRWVVPFFSRLRDESGGAYIVLDVPYRDSAWEGGKVTPLLALASPYVDAVHCQTYFGLADMECQLTRARQHTDKPVYPIIEANASFDAQLALASTDPNCFDVSIWVAQIMNATYYEQLAKYSFGEHKPDPMPYEWQQPGFSALKDTLGDSMGEPIGLPYADNLGNVYQDGDLGFALWRKDRNENFWCRY